MDSRRRQDFADFAAAALPRLRALAFALTGSTSAADDLVQASFERLYRAWPRIRSEDPMRYARRVLVHRHISDLRRPWVRREQLRSAYIERASTDPTAAVGERLWLADALATLPQRQRHTVVLRYLEDLSVEEVAILLDCSPGTVKRASHDGLANLRRTLEATDQEVSQR